MSRFLVFASVLVLPLIGQTAFGSIESSVLNQIQFDNRENFFDTSPISGILGDIGDRLVGVLNANTINATTNQNPVTPEVTGVFDLTIERFIKIDNNHAYMLLRPTNVTGTEGVLAGHSKGTAVAFYEGGPANVQATLDNPTKTTADVFLAASDGTFYDDFGFGDVAANGASAFDSPADWGAAGNGYWFATVTAVGGFVGAGTNPTVSLSASSNFYYGLTGLAPTSGYTGLGNTDLSSLAIPAGTLVEDNREDASEPKVPTTLFALTGKGSTKLNNAAAGTSAADQAKFGIFSQDPARVQPLPEPSTFIAWAGIVSMSLIYFGYSSQKKWLSI